MITAPINTRRTRKYKYVLINDLTVKLPFNTGVYKETEWYILSHEHIIIKKNYASDGCTLVPDFKGTKRASIVHDCLYQFQIFQRELCDFIFYYIMKQDNCKVSLLYFNGVRIFGQKYYDK